jgi:hypothetical protein
MLERDLERYFTKVCKDLGVLSLKLNVRYSRGWPDRVVAFSSGRVLWIELKRPEGKLSALQSRVHEQLRSRGHEVLVLRTKHEILDALTKE